MSDTKGDFDLTLDELRAVARFAAESAQQVLADFTTVSSEDPRPRAALDAALTFANGAPRTNLQRTTAVAAHRAAKEVTSEPGRLAAQACGDAAAAAYLHPIAKATQVGHILRASACAALIADLRAGDDNTVASMSIKTASDRATPTLLDVLRRYPSPPQGSNRLAQIMSELDAALRSTGTHGQIRTSSD